MNQTIYFRKETWEYFQHEADKSKLVNELLQAHYSGSPAPGISPPSKPDAPNLEEIPGITTAAKIASPTAKEEKETFDDFLRDYSQPGVRPPHPIWGYPCCHKKNRCKHWEFDEINTSYKNTLTNEIVDASF